MSDEQDFTQLQRQYKKLERNYNALLVMQEQTERLRITNDRAKELSNFYNRLLLKNTPSITFMLDLDLLFVLGSDSATSLLGFADFRELLGRPFAETFSNAFSDEWIAAITANSQEVISTGMELSFEERVTLKDKRTFVFRVNITPAQEQDGLCKGVVIVMNDVSELTHAIEAAEAASHAKTDFLSNMSHEMRTPMNAIIGMTTIALAANDIEKKEYCLKKIDEASKHLLGVINDILDMSKIEAQKFSLNSIDFEFNKMLRQVMTVNESRVVEKNQRFAVEIDPAIPSRLHGDDQHLAQVITNLLSNAVKFTPEGGMIGLKVRLLGVTDEQCVLEFRVIDTGIGVSEEQRAHLFASFEQADSSISRRFGGTGLGLAISKEIVNMMGGTIWMESELDKGSTFIFTVQLALGEEMPDDQARDEGIFTHASEAEQRMDFKGNTILLAEDVEVNQEIVIALLEPAFVDVVCADNGVEAVRLFSEDPERYDMIFMDVQMPEMDGLEATRMIRALGTPKARTIPIVAMTANVFREDVERCLAAGMNSHIGKPLDFDSVFEKLKAYLK
jgi:PAS domain S-box-containing protein